MWGCFVVMIVGMVDDRAMRLRQRASGRQPRPTPQPVAPTPGPLDDLGQNYLRAAPRVAQSAAETNIFNPVPSITQAVGQGRLPTGAEAGTDAALLALTGALGLGAKALQPVARTAMGTTARTLANNERLSPGVRNVMELINARHASPNPNLGSALRNPKDVPVVSGRDFGPGFYYEARRPLDSVVPYTDLLARYGDNFYMPQMSPAAMLKIARSKGGADLRQDLGLEGVNRVSQMPINNPVFRKAMEDGFTGVKGRTSWLVGNPERVGGLPNIGVRPVTAADDATYPQLESLLRRIFPQ